MLKPCLAVLLALSPAAALAGEAKPTTPPIIKTQKLDLAAEIAKSEKACKRPGASRADRERLAALYILAGRSADGRRKLTELFSPANAQAGLKAAAEFLKAEVRKHSGRGKDVRPGREEILARLRLAAVALALDSPTEVERALEPLGPLTLPGRPVDKYEVRRLALLGAASWSTGEKIVAGKCLEDLLRKATSSRRLRLRAATLVDRVRSYGVYNERKKKTVAPGESVLIYCEVLNFACNKLDSGGWLTALDVDLKFETDDIDRRSIKEIKEYSQVRHRTRSNLRDLHLVIRVTVPRGLVPGESYVLQLTVRDQGAASIKDPTPARRRPEGEKKPEKTSAPRASASIVLRVAADRS